MLMFNSPSLDSLGVRELFILSGRVRMSIVCLRELVLLSLFHGLFINTSPRGAGSSVGGRLRRLFFQSVQRCVCVCVFGVLGVCPKWSNHFLGVIWVFLTGSG